MEVAHVQLGAGRTPTQGGHFDFLQFGLLQPLRLRSPVLEPDLHLRLGKSQRGREFGALGDAQVLLLTELLLEGEQLLGGERGAGFAVGLVFAQVALDAGRLVVVC